MKRIELHGARAAGRAALVDDDDYELASAHRWYAAERRRSGHQPRTYAITSIYRDGKRTTLSMHALIAGGFPDHIDHDGLNNQRSNLRAATGSQNQGNRRPDMVSSSRFKGVSWDAPRNKWRATLCGRIVGRFADEADAARAYDAAALAKWGDFAFPNFPRTVARHA